MVYSYYLIYPVVEGEFDNVFIKLKALFAF